MIYYIAGLSLTRIPSLPLTSELPDDFVGVCEAVTTGRQAKTIDNYFCKAETAQSNEPAEPSVSRR